MRSWMAALAALLVVAPLTGCLDLFTGKDGRADPDAVKPADVGYDPSKIQVTGFEKTPATIQSFDGVSLSTVIYSPVTGDTQPDGTPPKWGVVLALHGWGEFKEQFEGVGGSTGAPVPADPSGGQVPFSMNRLEAYARAGLIAVAYDARGFGQSGGEATVAGAAEMADIDAVLDYVEAHYATNGLVGIVGTSYGGGQAYHAFADDPRITTAVPMYGWVDLYDGLLPGNVVKSEWAALLLGAGGAGSKARMSPLVAEWASKAPTRSDLETVHAQMDARSALDRLGQTDKPLFVCQGMQETLFPQADRAWSTAAGFTRALVFTGGHGADPEECWSRSIEWFSYFVAGKDTGVDAWPALTTVDASGLGEPLEYVEFPQPVWKPFYLRAGSPGNLAGEPSNTTFTVQQRLLSNPFMEPSGVWDLTMQPNNEMPEQFRQDPTAVFFDSAPLTGSEVLLGAPVVHLQLADANQAAPYQVVAAVYKVDEFGKSILLSRGAHAALSEQEASQGVLDLEMTWVKASLEPKDMLVLKLGANDPSIYAPLLADYSVDFTGASVLSLPFFEG